MEIYGYEFILEDDLKHYGLKGMHWGTRHWQNYDSTNTFNVAGIERYFGRTPGKNSKARSEPKIYHKPSNINEKKTMPTHSEGEKYTKRENDEAKRAARLLGASDADAEKLKKIAKIAGISLATTAGVMVAGYLLYNNREAISDGLAGAIALTGRIETGYNNAGTHHAYKLGEKFFNNASNGDPVGYFARNNGFTTLGTSNIRTLIQNKKTLPAFKDLAEENAYYNNLIKTMRLDQISAGSSRRLSCWSGSNAYFLNVLTGTENCVSRSFTNLVDFNDFGKLYTKAPEIFKVNGTPATNYVGKFGQLFKRGNTASCASDLVRSIFRNISEKNNLSPDGLRTVGFINAGYHSTTCTHQWNFELIHRGNGIKELIMADSWSGERWAVAKLNKTLGNRITWNTAGFSKLIEELGHYNADSIRFYAPSLESVNPEMMANVVLGKIAKMNPYQVTRI